MIKKLQRKIMLVLMMMLSIILLSVMVYVNIVNYKTSRARGFNLINKMMESNGDKSYYFKNNIDSINKANRLDSFRKDAGFRLSQFYTVKLDISNNIISIINENSGGYSDKDIEEIVGKVIKKGKDEGVINNLLYAVNDTIYGKIIIFLDYSIINENIVNLLKYSIAAGIMGIIVSFIISLLLSKWIVKPVKESFEKQKGFISDASHELKTPLTIISANADVLEEDIGENKWLKYIKAEALMMNSLVNKLLTLARLESVSNKESFSKINFSKIVMGAAMPFESIAFESGISLNYEIDNDIYIFGDEYELKQVVAILIDNAIKHTENKGHIIVSLKHSRNKVILKVMNDGEEIAIDDREKIFDRFYRGDESRNRDDKRYGLGLAIAKAIVENHKGKIKVEGIGGWTEFVITL